MEKLKIAFADFWPEWNVEDFITPRLKKHYDIVIDQNSPDVLFHSIFNRMAETPKFKCKKVLILAENWRPSQFNSDYSISFDPHTEKNYRLPLWQIYCLLWPDLREKLFGERLNHSSFDRFCSFTVSNPSNFYRNGFFDELHAYKRVHSYGKVKTNDFGLRYYTNGKYWRDAKNEFFIRNKHKFAIAFENTSYPGYSTEKIMDAFLAGSVPIYWGSPTIHKEFNEKSFINVIRFSNEDLMKYIKMLDNDENEFLKIYNEPIFTDEQRENHIKNIENFESWLVNKIKE